MTGAGDWDEDYQRRGRLWGGTVQHIPPIPPGSRMLELGCGNGKTLECIFGAGLEIASIDFSSEATALCRRMIPHDAYSNTSILVADARCLPFAGNTFDIVFAFHLIGHSCKTDREQISGECARVLRKGGTLHFTDFSVEDMRAGKGRETEDQTFERGKGIFTHYFSEQEIEGLFSRLVPVRIATERWTMRVRGRDLLRAEVAGVFKKG